MEAKIVALIVVIVTALTPVLHMACARGICDSYGHSPSMPCHAMDNPKSDEAFESALDHSCCHLLPVLPVPACNQITVQSSEQRTSSPLLTNLTAQVVSEHSLETSAKSSPQRCQQQSSVLLI
jgi:hypothetical protein